MRWKSNLISGTTTPFSCLTTKTGYWALMITINMISKSSIREIQFLIGLISLRRYHLEPERHSYYLIRRFKHPWNQLGLTIQILDSFLKNLSQISLNILNSHLKSRENKFLQAKIGLSGELMWRINKFKQVPAKASKEVTNSKLPCLKLTQIWMLQSDHASQLKALLEKWMMPQSMWLTYLEFPKPSGKSPFKIGY